MARINRLPAVTSGSDRSRRLLRAHAVLLAAGILGFVAVLVGMGSACPAAAAQSSPPPFTQGKHLYDDGQVFSPTSAALVETLAARIESEGGGRVAVYSVTEPYGLPSTTDLAAAWKIDGIVFIVSSESGSSTMGSRLKTKLTKDQLDCLETSNGMSSTESWVGITLARLEGFLSKKHVFEGSGLLDASAVQQVTAAADKLGKDLGADVYVDIALGGRDAFNTAFFNGAHMSGHLGSPKSDAKHMIIAIGISTWQIGAYLGEDNLFDAYHTLAPWSANRVSNTALTGTPQSMVLSILGDVQSGNGFDFVGNVGPWIAIVLVIVVLSIAAPLFLGPWLIRKLTGVSAPIENGVATSAVIQSIADTGVTVSMPSVGPEAPEYKLGLLVTPPGGSGAPYMVETKVLIPRVAVPIIVPGATIGVIVDPADPQKINLDMEHLNNPVVPGFGAPGYGAAAFGQQATVVGGQPFFGAPAMTPGGPTMPMSFDAAGNPNMAQATAFASAVSQGTMPTHSGSAARLLATGTHGTAVITTVMPLGKTVRQVNPGADPAILDDPVWMFTVEATVPGQASFPSIFGHRVPRDKLALLGPGVKLAVAVDMSDRNEEVAIDWDRSPITTI